MAEIIPITTYIDITVTDSVPLSFPDLKIGLILTTDTFNPDWVVEYSGSTPLVDIGTDFGTDSDIYKAATSYFSQSPKPAKLLVGIFSDTIPATAFGGTPSSIETIEAISDGAMLITTSTGTETLTGLDFTGVTSLNDALLILQAAAVAQDVTTPIRYGATGFEIYGAIAFPTDIASIPATAGFLTGGGADALASFQAITSGGFDITVDGTPLNITDVVLGDTQAVLTGGVSPAAPGTLTLTDYRIALTITSTPYETSDMDFSGGVSTEAEVVQLIQTEFNSSSIPATISFDGSVYVITTTGFGAVTITTASTPAGGTDLGALIKLDSAGGGSVVAGIVEVATLSEAATRISSAVAGATCVYDSVLNNFILTSDTTGIASIISFATAPASGQDLSVPTSWRSVLGAVVTAGADISVPDATVDTLGLVATANGAHLEVEQTGVIIQTVLNNIIAANSGWQILTVTKEFRADNVAVAAWTETYDDRIFIATDSVTDPGDPSNGGIMLSFFNSNYTASSAIFHSQTFENEYLDAGIAGFYAGMNLSISNGYTNLTFETIAGITADNIGSPSGIQALNGNYYAAAGQGDQVVKDIVYPAFMANGLLVSEKIANINIQLDLQAAGFRVVASANNVPLSARGAAIVKTALENAIENKWKINGYVPKDGGEYVDDTGVTISLPKGYIFNVFTTPDSKADQEFLVEGTILKEGSVIKVTGSVSVQQAS